MTKLRYILLIVLSLFTVSPVFAQMIEDPTTWTYEVKGKGNHQYELIFHLTIKKEWHIWSMTPGGDGFLIPPTYKFDKNVNVQLVGKITEDGVKVTTEMEGIDGKVTFLSGKVDYVQVVNVKGACKITGKHEYQVCNDNTCLPPKTLPFSFEIKE